MKIEYIEGDIQNGIQYDFTKIKKEFRKLNIPKDVYSPLHLPLDTCKWFVTLSERSRGKTTNLLLLGMVFNKLYGTEIQYLRSSESMIVPKNSKDLFNNIISWGYVEKLTDGLYNTIIYKSRRWYYAKVNNEGEIIDKADHQFCTMLSIDKNEVYKSSYDTAGKGDFIIFDEFIERYYYPQQFIMLNDLISTILRSRLSGMIFLCANVIDKLSPYFSELMISDKIETMERGDNAICTTPLGTKVYVEILGDRPQKASKRQNIVNSLYYGFKNPKLVSITGNDTWALNNYPHTPKDFKILKKNHYIQYNDTLVNLEICEQNNNIFINCHKATQLYDDSIVYSLDFDMSPTHRYKLGHTDIDKFIWGLYQKNLFTYSDNSIGNLVEKYYQLSKR